MGVPHYVLQEYLLKGIYLVSANPCPLHLVFKNQRKEIMYIKRHGDLMLQVINKIPNKAKKVMSGKLNKLALGEVTGHSHKLKTDVDTAVYEFEGANYFEFNGGTLSHEEHETIKTITDKTVVVKQWVKKEFDYFAGELRAVRD